MSFTEIVSTQQVILPSVQTKVIQNTRRNNGVPNNPNEECYLTIAIITLIRTTCVLQNNKVLGA